MSAEFLLAFLFSISMQAAVASGISTTVSLDTNIALIGDQVKFTISITRDDETQVLWPDLGKVMKVDSTREIEIVSTSPVDTVKKSGMSSESRTYLLTVFDSGYYVIPPATFKFKEPGTDSFQIALTEPLLLTIKGIEVDTTAGFKPIKDPLKMPFKISEIIKELGLGALVLALIVAVVLYMSYRKKKPVIIKRFVRKDPPHEIALNKLRQLEEKKLWQQGEIKPYYSELSEIIREYIEGRYNILALESTTDEIMERIVVTGISHKTREELNMMLQIADLVKFAKANPLPDEHKRFLDTMVEFVKNTKTEQQAKNQIIEEQTP